VEVFIILQVIFHLIYS